MCESVTRLPTPGGGKRRSAAPLTTTSDESDDGDVPSVSRASADIETDSAVEDSSPLSPCSGSSTASGPIYIRPPGFKHHAHSDRAEIISRPRIKKKKKIVILRDGIKRQETTVTPKIKPKREPVPMRLRALPQSFWQQPNKPQPYSPAGVYPILPPLCKGESSDEESEIRPVTPPEENNNNSAAPRDKSHSNNNNNNHSCYNNKPERQITVTNADLLFKLFEGIEDNSKTKKQSSTLLRRSRSKRLTAGPAGGATGAIAHRVTSKTTPIALIAGEDPFLVEAVTEKLFPQLSLEHGSKSSSCSSHMTSSLHLVTLKEGDRSVTLPSLTVEQNYSQMLSELVMHI
ncbi:uncharacterized protein LOC141908299 [Tubulanus polymorphus]|uniref:uncharacterized protein LOC141908299 n=1 Tax=Tubulanus polymorphus TaxID=672921 RepID=UPI003DA68F38